MPATNITESYGNRIRIRVCGIAIENNSILLVNHSGISESGSWWAPPGGGVQLGESLTEALIREFKEETGLVIDVTEQLFVSEYIKDSLHAIEIFFQVKVMSGKLIRGVDPELSSDKQRIVDVKYVTFDELVLIEENAKHHCLQGSVSRSDVLTKKGYLPYLGKLNK